MVPPSALPLFIDIGAALTDAGGLLQYGLVFLFAAFPWVEILVVIPIAIGVGLDPVGVGVVAFVGNAGSVLVLLLGYRRVSGWWERRRSRAEDEEDGESTSRRRKWARRIWDRYGLPGLALAAPVLTGVHLAALLALAAGSRGRAIAGWMTVGIAAWTVVLVAGSAFGVSLV
ncbi:small multi-drug export protein [Halorubrum vacuolatum]|uniref:Putative small multi-drug export protein n=1 Tax=Halorubrum vacuolatum TaxID=63740 RepID=A0A238UNM4_HALVU|nr:small multi-drug export protein [Halorubrum vacuolatum]SNR23521.1 Putative small multi-drug export protein [Halorubrum vacuolatum]